MSFMDTKGTVAETYLQTDLYGGVESADPHRLIEMLLDGLVKNLTDAKLAIGAKDIIRKCTAIDKALNILDALRNGLDLKAGGDLAQNLDDLYDYLQRSLIAANLTSDMNTIDEVTSLVQMIKEAWSRISTTESGPIGAELQPVFSQPNTTL